MSQTPSRLVEAVPRWLIAVGSAVILFHLGAVVIRVLAATSGPWPTEMGPDRFMPPQFAFSANRMTLPYLRAVGLTDDYHFPSNHPGLPGVYVEFRLRDAAGEEVGTARLPDPDANFWVRHRQSLLAWRLGNDLPVNLPRGEMIAAPNQQVQEREFWQDVPNEPRRMRLARQSVNQFNLNQFYVRPSEVAMVCTHSYVRHLCQTQGAEKVAVLRHHRDPIPPIVLSLDNIQAGAFEEAVSDFGEFTK